MHADVYAVCLQEDWHVLSFDAYVAEGVNGLQGTLHVHGPASKGRTPPEEMYFTLAHPSDCAAYHT